MLFNATPIVLFVSLFLESSPVRKWSIYLLIAQKVWDLAFNPEWNHVNALLINDTGNVVIFIDEDVTPREILIGEHVLFGLILRE